MIRESNVPKTCGDCEHFKDGETPALKRLGFTFCKLSKEVTYRFSDPLDRPLPRPTRCPYNPIKKED